ncbi:hypothetical protein LAZ67_2004495 [Cordylochernes scorpioides]|uniref:Uncharacterized protein n=1 Tax=Cordylochernes scorpioides TaxID=51811 RepID=A0ABY6K3S8_9ARAC|nr:hypothetical protein LAZ67_2004495 [Cordylochernes scorpioides]
MKAIPKTDYQRCFADWKKRWLKCIAANGDYFEGDNLNLRCTETSEALHWTRQQQYSIHTQDREHCDCCDRDARGHLRLFIGHGNNNNTVYTPKIVDIATAVIDMHGDI